MELYKEILINLLEKNRIEVNFVGINDDFNKIMELECYKVLAKIREVIKDTNYDDKECFERIEKIVEIFEDSGISCGVRHDF